LFRDLLGTLEARDPPERYTRLYVVVDNYKLHQAKAVEPWLAHAPTGHATVLADRLSSREPH
jgi:hypothetical protein